MPRVAPPQDSEGGRLGQRNPWGATASPAFGTGGLQKDAAEPSTGSDQSTRPALQIRQRFGSGFGASSDTVLPFCLSTCGGSGFALEEDDSEQPAKPAKSISRIGQREVI
jgi:hypothetical protein